MYNVSQLGDSDIWGYNNNNAGQVAKEKNAKSNGDLVYTIKSRQLKVVTWRKKMQEKMQSKKNKV